MYEEIISPHESKYCTGGMGFYTLRPLKPPTNSTEIGYDARDPMLNFKLSDLVNRLGSLLP